MGRKAVKFSEHWVQMSDFRRTKNMSKKSWWACKIFIDWLLSDIEKRDREILMMSETMKKQMKDSKETILSMRELKDRQLESAQLDYERVVGLYHDEMNKNTGRTLLAIVCALAAIVMWICLFI